MPKILKCVFKKESNNPNARYSPNYLVVEYLAQTPCVMSTLEVLQSCPSQRNALLDSIGSLESIGLVDNFDMSNVKPHFPYLAAFNIELVHGTKTIGRMVIDGCASTCVIEISCWLALGSPDLVPYTTLITAFDGRYFLPHGILPSFDIELVGKVVSVEVEVVEAPLNIIRFWVGVGIMLCVIFHYSFSGCLCFIMKERWL